MNAKHSATNAIECPACGSAVSGCDALTRSLACPHCGNWIYVDNQSWVDGGRFEHEITAPAFLRIGKTGKLDGKDFTIKGRVRLEYARGTWDEWWLVFDDGNGQWLEEDDGIYLLHIEQSLLNNAETPHATFAPGQMLNAAGHNWFITEKLEATVAGAEGELPVAMPAGSALDCLDAVADGRELSIENWHDGAIASISEAVSSDRLQWS